MLLGFFIHVGTKDAEIMPFQKPISRGDSKWGTITNNSSTNIVITGIFLDKLGARKKIETDKEYTKEADSEKTVLTVCRYPSKLQCM